MTTEDNSQELKKILQASFEVKDLRSLCFDLKVDYEELEGATKTEKIQSLITFLEHRGRLNELAIGMLNNRHPQKDSIFFGRSQNGLKSWHIYTGIVLLPITLSLIRLYYTLV